MLLSTSSALDEALSYDVIGNIKSLNRGGVSSATLTYAYNIGGQLQAVTNSGSAFRSYGYDANGNATSDGGSKSISYNLLNLPRSVGSNVATYTYDAAGEKVRNTGTDGTWDYDDGIVYYNGAIDFISTKEGRLVPNGTNYTYQYNLQDHLGNNRVSFYSNSGTASLLQEDEYYSFGLRRSLYDNSNDNRYLYNGKEIQTDLVNNFDFGSRFYDSFIGRWGSVDPLAEKDRRWSLYNYGFNNPVRFIDPDGMWPDDDDDPNKQKGFFRPPTSGQKLLHPFLSAWQSLSYSVMDALGVNEVDDKIADMSSKSKVTTNDALNLGGKIFDAAINIATIVDGAEVGKIHGNSNEYVGHQGVYEIKIDGETQKFGKSDMTKTSKTTGRPVRLQSQLNKLQKTNLGSNVEGEVIYQNKNISTKKIKEVETQKIQEYIDQNGKYPPKNQNHPGTDL